MHEFETDIRDQVMASLPYDPSQKSTLDAMPLVDLFTDYFNWRFRYVARETRTVHQSKEILANSLAADPRYQAALAQIVSDISAGADLTRYLSRGIKHGYKARVPGSYVRQRDMDMMLNDWSVHHLHLSTSMEQDGFVSRTPDVLFAAFRPDDAYLINIFPHNSWATNDVADILIDNWPKSQFVHEVPNAVSLEFQPTEGDRTKTRDAGIAMPMYQRNGKVYMVGLGTISSAGTSSGAARFAMHLMRKAREFAKTMAADPTFFATELRKAGITPATKEHFRFKFCDNDHFAILEESSGALCYLH